MKRKFPKRNKSDAQERKAGSSFMLVRARETAMTQRRPFINGRGDRLLFSYDDRRRTPKKNALYGNIQQAGGTSQIYQLVETIKDFIDLELKVSSNESIFRVHLYAIFIPHSKISKIPGILPPLIRRPYERFSRDANRLLVIRVATFESERVANIDRSASSAVYCIYMDVPLACDWPPSEISTKGSETQKRTIRVYKFHHKLFVILPLCLLKGNQNDTAKSRRRDCTMNGHTCTDLHDGVRNRREKSSSARFGTHGSK
nr:unnamed protein product [Callosobruchus chinensis]